MNYCLVLAGGKGTRMGNTEVPKQFLSLKGVPIIVHCIRNIQKSSLIDKVIVVCHKDYIGYFDDLLAKYGLGDFVEVTNGGDNRLMSAVNGIKYIENKFGINDDDIILAHDSVRIFTSTRILDENIINARLHGAATTVYYLEETILKAGSDGLLYRAYPRENRFSGQSPQTFNIKKFMGCFRKLTQDQRDSFTDLAEVLYVNDEKVFPVIGDKDNIKITTPFDLILAEMRLDGIRVNN